MHSMVLILQPDNLGFSCHNKQSKSQKLKKFSFRFLLQGYLHVCCGFGSGGSYQGPQGPRLTEEPPSQLWKKRDSLHGLWAVIYTSCLLTVIGQN